MFYIIFFSLIFILGFFASGIKLSEDITQMLPDEKSTRELSYIFKNSKLTDKIIFCISGKDSSEFISPDSLIGIAENLAYKINHNLGEFVESVEYKSNDSLVSGLLALAGNKLPLFLDDQDYLKIDSMISGPAIRQKLENNYKSLTGPAGIILKKYILNDPLGINYLALQKFQNLNPDDQVDLYAGYFFTRDHRNILMMVTPQYSSSETSKNVLFFDKLNVILDSISTPSITVDYFGAPAVAASNSKQIRADTYLTITIALVLLILVILFFFRNIFYSFLMLVPVIMGILFALAIISLTKESISVIAIGGGSIILGIAVNYSLHLLIHARYYNIRETIKEITHPLLIGNITTIGGFLCLQFVNVPVLKDLGLFAALSLAGAALATLIFLPQWIKPNDKKITASNETDKQSNLKLYLSKPGFRLVFILAFISLTGLSLYYFNDIAFENDLYKINYMSPRLKKSESKINSLTSFNVKAVFYLSTDSTLNTALDKTEAINLITEELIKSGKIRAYSGVKNILMSENLQNRKIDKWNSYWTGDKKQKVVEDLIKCGKEFHFIESGFNPFKETIDKKYIPFTGQEQSSIVNQFFKNFINVNQGLVTVTSIIKVDSAHIKEVYNRMGSVAGIHIFDRQYITQSLVKTVGQNFNFIAISSSLLVFIVLLITYGRIEITLITFIPMVISWIWIIGIMAAFHIKFNIINVILSTFVFGLGDDFSIFTIDGLIQKYVKLKKDLKPVRMSILLATITTVVGLGVLIIAKHPALKSIALVSIIGILSVWIVSQTLQPVLFDLIITNRVNKGRSPITFIGFFKSLFAFSYFILGAYLLTPIGFILTKIFPFSKTKNLYHWILSKSVKSLIYIMINLKKNIMNPGKEDFSKSAVLIANHQSFLDILFMIMLHPKLILFTNQWVWNSPVFGWVVRLAGFYPVMDGFDEGMEKLKFRLKQGYSIVIFPEGTRSEDKKIGRFHKGAFFVAEKLNLDIIPVLIHGSGYSISKGDFYLNDGKVSLKILPRITPENNNFGSGYVQRTKSISKYFKKEFEKLKSETESVHYFKDQLIKNYLYKGPVLEWYLRIKLKFENDYELFDNIVPKEGKILDIGCGYGFISNMLSFTSGKRTITGIDYDEEKIDIARNGYLTAPNVSFYCQDARELIHEKFDAIILADVLHYLKIFEQKELMEKCYAMLSETGIIIIRDGFTDYKSRHLGTRLSELFSTKILNFNKTTIRELCFPSIQSIYKFAESSNLAIQKTDNTRFTSNIIFVLKKTQGNA